VKRFARWLTVRSLAWSMKRETLTLTEIRETFERTQAHRSGHWRDEIWHEARERAARS